MNIEIIILNNIFIYNKNHQLVYKPYDPSFWINFSNRTPTSIVLSVYTSNTSTCAILQTWLDSQLAPKSSWNLSIQGIAMVSQTFNTRTTPFISH